MPDELFRAKKKHGAVKTVNAPHLLTSIADSHAHLQLLEDPSLALARAGAHEVAFVETMVDVVEDGAITYERLGAWIDRAQLLVRQMGSLCCGQAPYDVPHVRIAAGVHPHNAKAWTKDIERKLLTCLKDPRTSALGEVGLDYHYDLSPRDDQKRVFARQIELAHASGLPIILHVREAFDDAYDIMEAAGWNPAGVLLHCYTADAAEIERWVQAGCFVAFGGALTFNRSDDIRAALRCVPLDRLLLETDAPYMAPVPLRGQECEPAMVVFTAQRSLVELLGEGATQTQCIGVLAQTLKNTYALLDRPASAWQQREEK